MQNRIRMAGSVVVLALAVGSIGCASNGRVDALEKRIDELSARVDGVEGKADLAVSRAEAAEKSAAAAVERADEAARTAEAIFNKSVRK